jgi:nucleotide-binding universal stress UspA family protein
MADLQQIGASLLAEAERTAREAAPDLEVSTVLTRGERTTGVVRAAEGAQLVAVGRESRRGIERMLTGTATASIATHAPCDVVVVPSFWVGTNPRGRVVVGVKRARDTHDLLAQAFTEAAARSASLRLVMVWHISDPYSDSIEARTHSAEWERNGVVHGSAARVLLQESSEADLLVISRRRLSLPPYGQLGGVGHDVLRLSDVPVQVVPYAPDPAKDEEELVLEEAGAPLK